jgi:hypothetical protein
MKFNMLTFGRTSVQKLFGKWRSLLVDDGGRLSVSDVGVTATTTTRILQDAGPSPHTLTTAYSGSVTDWMSCADCHEMRYDITSSVATPATIEIDPQWSPDDGTTVIQHPVVNSVSGAKEQVSDLFIELIGQAGGVVAVGGHSVTVKRPKRALLMRLRLRDPGSSSVEVYVDATPEV